MFILLYSNIINKIHGVRQVMETNKFKGRATHMTFIDLVKSYSMVPKNKYQIKTKIGNRTTKPIKLSNVL